MRIRSLFAALVVTVFHISCTLSQNNYDPQCIIAAQASLQLAVQYNGTSWPSCGGNETVPRCVQTGVSGNGNTTYNALVQCVTYNQVGGCGINSAPGCGIYDGPIGTYGVQIYQGNGLTSINTTGVQAVLNNFYPQIGYDNSVSLCCGPVTCRLVSVQSINIDVCETGEYMLKCAGDSLHGICNVWNSAETGEYLLINVDPSVATSTTSSSASASSSASTSFSASTSSSTGQTSSRHAPVPIIVGVTIVGVIVSLTVVYLLYRYRKNVALSSAAGQASPRPQAPNGAGEAFQVPTVGLSSVVGPESVQSQYCAPPVIDQSHLLPWSVNLPLASQS
jgi:hypothetical protein